MHSNNHRKVNSSPAPRSHGFAGRLTYRNQDTAHSIPALDIAGGLNTGLEINESAGTYYAFAGTTPAYTNSDKGLASILVGNPKWTISSLSDISKRLGSSAALAAAYLEYGEGLTEYLRGDFSFAVLDSRSDTALLGLDRMGRFPLYFVTGTESLLFGTSASSVLSMLPERASLSQQGLYNYIYFHMIPSPSSVFKGLQKLQAGCVAHVSSEKINLHRYWQPNFREKARDRRPAMYSELKTRLKQAVVSSLPASGKTGAFLSGGLDSSTVTGMLAEATVGPCDVYSIGFAAKGYDEMAYARNTANHFGATLHEYYVTPEDVVEALPHIARSYDEPFGNSSALPAYFCARLAAEDGVSLLLAGDGGDEIFAGNERYAKQKTFELYQHVPSLVSSRLIEPLVSILPAYIPLSGKVRSYITQTRIPLPDRLQTYNFLNQNLASEVFQQSYLANVDKGYPLRLQRDIYNAPTNASSLNRMLFLDWQITLADNDLRKVSHTCAMAGVDVAYPMLDDELVEFAMGIPSNWKLPGRELRSFYKKALTGWLPEATLNKSKQGFGLPFGVWMSTHRPLQEIAYDNILKLKSRNIFSAEFLDNAVTMHRESHAAYYGELIWVLTVLELWLSSHLDEIGTAGSKED